MKTVKKQHQAGHELPLAGTVKAIVFGSTHGVISLLSILTGVATASGDRATVLISGTVALLAGAVTMLCVEYVASKSQKETWQLIVEHERAEFKRKPKHEINEMRDYYLGAGFSKTETGVLIKGITGDEGRWLEAHLAHAFDIFPRSLGAPVESALQLAAGHLAGGMLPLAPYFFFPVNAAFLFSIALSLVALFAIGAANPQNRLKNAVETLFLATLAASASYLIGMAVKSIV